MLLLIVILSISFTFAQDSDNSTANLAVNNDEFIYGYKQYMILCICEILKNNGIIPSIFQVSNCKQHKKIIFKDDYYKIKFIVNDDLYTLNNYDCTIYDSLAFEFIKNHISRLQRYTLNLR